MGYKKVVTWSLLTAAIVGLHISFIGNSLDYRVCYLKRKANCLNRKVNKALKYMSEENLKKYKDELVKGYENIMNKIDNITIRDIKNKGNELVSNILDAIDSLKEKVITYSR